MLTIFLFRFLRYSLFTNSTLQSKKIDEYSGTSNDIVRLGTSRRIITERGRVNRATMLVESQTRFKDTHRGFNWLDKICDTGREGKGSRLRCTAGARCVSSRLFRPPPSCRLVFLSKSKKVREPRNR